MFEANPKTANPAGNPTVREVSDSQWDRFEDFVKKIAQVPKAEVDELRAEREREKKEDL